MFSKLTHSGSLAGIAIPPIFCLLLFSTHQASCPSVTSPFCKPIIVQQWADPPGAR